MDQAQLIEQMLKAAEMQRQQRQARLEEALAQRAPQPGGVNLTPLAALADSMAGTKIAGGVQAQANDAQAYNKRSDELLDQLNSLRAEKGNIPLNLLQDKNKQDAIGERFDTAQESSMFKEVKRDFDNIRKPLDEIDQQFNGIESALTSGDYERIKGQLSNFARAVNKEKGVLTDNDVGRTYIDTVGNIYDKFASRFEKGQKVNPADVRQLADALKEARAKTAEVAAVKHQDVVDTYQSNPFGATVLRKMGDKGLVGGTEKRIQQIGSSPKMGEWYQQNFQQAGSSGAPAVDPKKRLEELRAKAAKGA